MHCCPLLRPVWPPWRLGPRCLAVVDMASGTASLFPLAISSWLDATKQDQLLLTWSPNGSAMLVTDGFSCHREVLMFMSAS